jgi:hypothetical protein
VYTKIHTTSGILFFSTITVLLLSFGLTNDAFAEVLISDRQIIDSTTVTTEGGVTLGLLENDMFGYHITNIGDLDGDGVIDLAVSSYRDSNPGQHDDEGSVIIMFMNSDGTVKKTNKILHDNSSDGLGSCIDNSANVDPDVSGFESMAYLGDLINGNPTLALGAPWDNYGNTVNAAIHNTGAIYLLELNSTSGKVNSCVRIVDNDGSLFNPSSVRTTSTGAQLGFALTATDLDGDETLELLTNIRAANGHDDLWAFYLDSDGAITTATEYKSSSLGINSYWDSISTINGGNKIAIGKESTGVSIVNFVGNTGVLSSINLITDSSVGSSSSGFGSGIESIGDMDGDGVIDLMVGAYFTDDNGGGGGNDEGVVYILFMNNDDTVKEYQTISNTSEKERTGSTFLQTDDFFGNSIEVWMNSNGQIVVAIGAHAADAGATNEGELYLFYISEISFQGSSDSGGCDDCIDPTFYYSQNKNIVKDGFRYNDYSTNVTGNLHADIPFLFTYTNQTNFLTLKVYDNFGTDAIKWIDVAFGSSGPYASIDNAEIRFETKFSDNSIVQSWVYPKDQNLIDFRNATASIVDCGYFGTFNCLQITIPHTFRDELRYPGIVILAEDASGNSKSHYLNDGIVIQGKPLNEPPTDKVFIQKYLGDPQYEWVDIVRIDRSNDIWESEDGIKFKHTEGGGFKRSDPIVFED